MDLTDKLVDFVRRALGMRLASTIDLLALYPATVNASAADGSTVDVTPLDDRVRPHQGVPLRVPLPGAVAVVKPGAVVLLGWEGGDPQKLYALPSWYGGAGATKVTLGADAVELAAGGGDAVVTKKDLQILYGAINAAGVTPGDGGAALKAAIIAALGTAGWSATTGVVQLASSKVTAAR